MKKQKDMTLVNCISTALLACFITVPGHELLHLLTHMAYGSKLLYYSAGAVDAAVADWESLSVFDRIMVAGGSASILNAVFGIVLMIILLKTKKMKPMMRLFLTQLMGGQMVQGIGYFLIGGLFGAGDWGQVYSRLAEYPGIVSALRIVLSVTGACGIMALFFILNHMSWYFIENVDDRKERIYVAFRLHLIVLIVGFTIGMICSGLSPAMKDGFLNWGMCFLFNFMWIPFFWGFMFTGIMKVLPPKKSRFLYRLPSEPDWILLGVSIALALTEIFVFGPGIYLG